MDFLVLFLSYLATVLASVIVLCVCSKTGRLRGLVGGATQRVSRFIPECLQRSVRSLFHYLFHTRELASEAEWGLELNTGCGRPSQPYLLLAVSLVFFAVTCVSNPGIVTKANELSLLQVYDFDEAVFPKDARCSACDVRKPARSKHCRVCNWCVHRFDHHCVWVNNCIGAWNTRYFLIYLSALTTSAATMAAVSSAFLIHLAAASDLYQESYVDDLGHWRTVDVVFLTQYLFLTFPRVVLLLGFLTVLSLLLGGYLCFTVYLAVTNQTAREWYRQDSAQGRRCPLVAGRARSGHSRGLRANLREIFLPVVPCCEGKKE
ncbi:palmitoyltransferase ZDHHC4 isoform X2 [Ochotona princeps]|uniref:palmitoyltransferase ZDHHC4 isoform X2 n=1 Tax=Ochotona princeps TaxID=9978 RepID=UPI00271530C8|nr:palmitoyltransferase ZDHHC4 isoform X2 [Ochotona princeps]